MPIGIFASEAPVRGALCRAGLSLSGPVLQVGTAVVWRRQGAGGLAPAAQRVPIPGLDLEPDAILLSSLTADYQGATYQVVADSPEFIELLAVPVGNIVAKIPDDESIDKDSDSRRFVNVIAMEPARRRTRDSWRARDFSRYADLMISRKREISLECVFKSPLGHPEWWYITLFRAPLEHADGPADAAASPRR